MMVSTSDKLFFKGKNYAILLGYTVLIVYELFSLKQNHKKKNNSRTLLDICMYFPSQKLSSWRVEIFNNIEHG